jgi:hypothetical protein
MARDAAEEQRRNNRPVRNANLRFSLENLLISEILGHLCERFVKHVSFVCVSAGYARHEFAGSVARDA